MVEQNIGDISVLDGTFDALTIFEKRIENDGSGNPIYIGYSKNANAATSSDSWLIFKLSYTGGYIVRYQLPDSGPTFGYAWDDRATLFS